MVLVGVPNRFAAGPRETSLVHEAYIRLANGRQPGFRSREHLLAVAAQAMRFVLVDGARRRGALKRNGGKSPAPIEDALGASRAEPGLDLLAVDEALSRLQDLHPRRGAIVELRFFGGLSNDMIAEELGVSLATVKREWQLARLPRAIGTQQTDHARLHGEGHPT